MKIAYIVLKGMPLGGGIEKYTEEIGSRLVNRGHEVTVYTMKHYGSENGIYKGMQVKTVSAINARNLEKMTASFISTLKQMRIRDFDIVHYHAFGPAFFSIIPKIMGKRIVVQGHGIEWKRARWGWLEKTFLKLTEMPSVKVPHVITVVSKVQQKYLKKKYGVESVYIPTGISPPRIEKPELIKQYGLNGNDYIFFAARLVREKGAHYLIEAYKNLNPDLKLVIAGDAKHEEKYKAELHKMAGGNEKIIFTGFVTGKLLDELFSNCYLFVLPSEIEGLPTVLLEAMSYGNCCLVSDIPENREALKNYGYTFKNKDVPDLTNKLKYLIEHEDALNSFKEKAKDYVLSHYSWDDIAIKFENLYEGLLK
jgi:glycosyltransferase involved in cell wall biosynthesis